MNYADIGRYGDTRRSLGFHEFPLMRGGNSWKGRVFCFRREAGAKLFGTTPSIEQKLRQRVLAKRVEGAGAAISPGFGQTNSENER